MILIFRKIGTFCCSENHLQWTFMHHIMWLHDVRNKGMNPSIRSTHRYSFAPRLCTIHTTRICQRFFTSISRIKQYGVSLCSYPITHAHVGSVNTVNYAHATSVMLCTDHVRQPDVTRCTYVWVPAALAAVTRLCVTIAEGSTLNYAL